MKYPLPYFVFIHRLPWRQTVSASTSQSRKCLIKLELSSSLLFRSIKFHKRVLGDNHSGFVFALPSSSWALRLDSDPSHVGCFFGICYYVPTLLCCSFLVLLAGVLQSAAMCWFFSVKCCLYITSWQWYRHVTKRWYRGTRLPPLLLVVETANCPILSSANINPQDDFPFAHRHFDQIEWVALTQTVPYCNIMPS